VARALLDFQRRKSRLSGQLVEGSRLALAQLPQPGDLNVDPGADLVENLVGLPGRSRIGNAHHGHQSSQLGVQAVGMAQPVEGGLVLANIPLRRFIFYRLMKNKIK